eukprot:gnl/TRDRNA2_/TRDRNA2_159301_c1_seq1.p2 gnl/TRDRNA2_/TRDRNA2_159301_c1~~gnl/TRDRNA2_/TRDRNA2_159301_c1_seq1.p2  ORF type:complete len:100 (+),score=11.14 gnl/TRDRNA2_/TRDRNA2_159301_c1_seq1:193-492(+)
MCCRTAEAVGLLVQHTVRRANLGEIGARQLGTVAHGAALCTKGEMLVALQRAAAWHAGECSARTLANTSWAFATVAKSDERLWMALSRASHDRLGDFNA